MSPHTRRLYSNLSPQHIALPTVRGGLDKSRLRLVRDFVEANPDISLGLVELADEAGLSPCHFSRTFKGEYGISPHQYVIARRVERAKAMLSERRIAFNDATTHVMMLNSGSVLGRHQLRQDKIFKFSARIIMA